MKVRSPYIGEGLAVHVEGFLKTRTSVDNASSLEEYRFVSGSLQGSWDTSISVNVKRQEWRSLRSLADPTARAVTVLCDCEPYLVIEGSVHKALLGHNVFGGPRDPLAATTWFIRRVAFLTGCIFPDAEQWLYERVDWAWLFDLGKGEACSEYLQAMALARYPRRKVGRYADQTVMFAGTTTAWKAYWKGPEFKKHDRQRVASTVGKNQAEEILKQAYGYIRFELSVKAKKLYSLGENDVNGVVRLPLIGGVDAVYLEELMDVETAKVVHEGRDDMETVRRYQDVEKRLAAVYDQRLANILLGFWSRLSAVGEKQLMASISRPTFYRQRKQLVDAGVSWVGSDVRMFDSAIPVSFSPRRDHPLRLIEEAPEVVEQLRLYRAA